MSIKVVCIQQERYTGEVESALIPLVAAKDVPTDPL